MYFDYIYSSLIKRKFYLHELNVLENIKFKLIEELITSKYKYILKLTEDGLDFFFSFSNQFHCVEKLHVHNKYGTKVVRS